MTTTDKASPATDGTSAPPNPVSFWTAFWFWLKLGFISFGGPAGQIAIMHAELVERRRWISERRFLHALNYCMLLPGPEAQQLATYIGWLMHRSWGGLVAGGLFVLPSAVLLSVLGWIYLRFAQLPMIAGVLYGIKPAVTAIVLFAAWRIGSRALKNNLMRGLALLSLGSISLANVPFPLIIATAALIGAIGGRMAPQYFALGGSHGEATRQVGAALIDDSTPIPRHARFTWVRFSVLVLLGVGLWFAAMAFLVSQFGWTGGLTQMAWFFTKAALLTFGGAYAVLPYVYQGVVEHFQWLTPTQMIDALALGETTPGPLIMVLTFVGFVAGWTQAVLGADKLLLGGVLAAAVVTFFTFLPSFLFIFAGGPLVESTHGQLRFTAPLSAITAAVVGVILNLAGYFAYPVCWPDGFGGRFDSVAASIAIVALLGLFRLKLGVVTVIGLSGGAGLLLALG